MCSHQMCQVKFESETQLHYHLSDTHGLQKAIWDTCGDELDNQKKLSTRADAVSQGKKRSQEWKGTKKRQRLGPGEAGKLRVIQWASPESSITTPSAGHNSAELERQSDGSLLDNHTGLSPAQLAQHSHTVPSDRFATPIRQYGETLFSSVDGSPGDLCENEPVSNAHIIECSTRSPSPQPDSSLTTVDASDLSTLYTSNEPGPSTTITSPEILPIDPRLMQDCNSSTLDEHESKTPEDRDLCGPAPTTSPMSPMPNNGSSFPQEALSDADTTTSLAGVNWETPSLTTASREKAHGKNPKRRCLNNNGVHTTNRLTRSMARRQATDGQRGYSPCPKIAKVGYRLSKEEDTLLRDMVKAGSNLQEAIQKFQMFFPNRSKASIQRRWYLMQPSPRITRSTSRIYVP